MLGLGVSESKGVVHIIKVKESRVIENAATVSKNYSFLRHLGIPVD